MPFNLAIIIFYSSSGELAFLGVTISLGSVNT